MDTPAPAVAAAAAAQKPAGVFESFQQGLATKLRENVIEPAIDFYNAPGETLERAGRAGLEFLSAFDPAGNAYQPTVQSQAARVEELNRRADERLPEAIKSAKIGQQVEEARPRSTAGKIALGAGSVIGDIAFPTNPETAVQNIVTAPLGGAAAKSVGKAVAPILRRIRAGKTGVAPATTGAGSEIEELAIRGGKPSEVGAAKAKQLELFESPLVQASEKSSVLETIAAARKAGLLTSATTHLRNVAGTATFQVSEELSKFPAAMLDVVMSLKTGKRSIAFPSGSKIVDTYVNGTFRLLNAEDKVAKAYAYRSALENRAKVQAINEAKEGMIASGGIGSRTRELITDPTEQLRINAIADAEIATFTNKNILSGAIGKGREYLKSQPGGDIVNFAYDMVVPFDKTPINIIARIIDYSPLGIPKTAISTLRKRLTNEPKFTQQMQRDLAQAFGRGSIGTGILILGYNLGRMGLATGLFEREDPSKRERDKAGGRPPGSILLGDRWWQLAGLAPLGNIIAIGATLAREDKQAGRDPMAEIGGVAVPGVGGASMLTATEAVTEQPLIQGAENVIRMVTRPGTASEEAGRLAGSFVPTIASDVAEAIDPQQREREGFTAQIQGRVPGLRQSLPGATDALGRPLQDRGPGGAMLDPFRSQVASQDPLMAELIRLDQGLSEFKKKPGESDDDYRGRVKQFGDLIHEYGKQLLNDQRYRNANDEMKRKALESLSTRAKVQVNETMEKGRRAAPAQRRLSSFVIMQSLLDQERRKEREER